MSDGFEGLKEAFVAWEAQMAAYWDAALRNPDFLQAMWPSVEAALQARQIWVGGQSSPISPERATAGPPPDSLLAEIARLQQTAVQLEQRLDNLLADMNDD